MDTNKNVTLQISNDGGATFPTTLATIAGTGANDPAYLASGPWTVPAHYRDANFRLRFFTSSNMDEGDNIFIDDVRIYGRYPATTAGGAPPNLASGYTLLPGETMTATFQVTVDDPLPPGTATIVNQAVWAHDGVTQPSVPTDTVTDSVNLTPAPVTSGPILSGATAASGTSTSPEGTIIDVYVNGANVGTTTVQAGGTWTLTGIGPLAAGDLVKATATDVVNGKATSTYSNTVIVQPRPPVVNSPINAGATSISGTSVEPVGSTITVYKNGVSIGTTTVQSGGVWTLSGVSGLIGGEATTATVTAGGQTSAVSNTVIVTPAPPVVNSPIVAGATSVTGTSTAPEGSTIIVYVNGTPYTTTVQAGGVYSVIGPATRRGRGSQRHRHRGRPDLRRLQHGHRPESRAGRERAHPGRPGQHLRDQRRARGDNDHGLQQRLAPRHHHRPWGRHRGPTPERASAASSVARPSRPPPAPVLPNLSFPTPSSSLRSRRR